MAIKRIEKNDNYTVISNVVLKDKALSLRAKGLLTLMLSYPDDWVFSVKQLVSTSKDGKDSVSAAIKELSDHGYIKMDKKRDAGKFVCYYTVYEVPPQSNRSGSTETVKPKRSNRSGSTEAMNPPVLNTDELMTKKPTPPKRKTHNSADKLQEFEAFWKAYPKKQNKPDAEKVWKKIDPPIDKVLSSLEKFKVSKEWTKENGQYIPYPASWLRGRRWEDEVEIKNSSKADYGSGASHF